VVLSISNQDLDTVQVGCRWILLIWSPSHTCTYPYTYIHAHTCMHIIHANTHMHTCTVTYTHRLANSERERARASVGERMRQRASERECACERGKTSERERHLLLSEAGNRCRQILWLAVFSRLHMDFENEQINKKEFIFGKKQENRNHLLACRLQ